MTRILLGLAVALALIGLVQRSARAEDAQWEARASENGCWVLYKLKDEHEVAWRQTMGFVWRTDGDFAFVIADSRVDGLARIPLRVVSAAGASFSGDALPLTATDKASGPPHGPYILEISGRKDLERAIIGDLTFSYQAKNGRRIEATAPFGMAVPRIDSCNSTAVALAEQQAKDAQQPPADEDDGDGEARGGRAAPTATSGPDADVIGNGTGVAVNALGYVVTDAHVVSPCGRLTSPGLGQAEVVAVDKASDLAILKFSRSPKAFVQFRQGALRLGERVVAAGYPLNDMLQNGLNVTVGDLSALSGPHGDRRFIQFSAPATFGNSGGPVVDHSGRLLGLVDAGIDAKFGQNISFAVATPTIGAFLDENQVAYEFGKEAPLTTEQIAAEARSHTLLLECRK